MTLVRIVRTWQTDGAEAPKRQEDALAVIILVAMRLIGLRTPWIYATAGSTLGIFPGLGRWVATLPAFVAAGIQSVLEDEGRPRLTTVVSGGRIRARAGRG